MPKPSPQSMRWSWFLAGFAFAAAKVAVAPELAEAADAAAVGVATGGRPAITPRKPRKSRRASAAATCGLTKTAGWLVLRRVRSVSIWPGLHSARPLRTSQGGRPGLSTSSGTSQAKRALLCNTTSPGDRVLAASRNTVMWRFLSADAKQACNAGASPSPTGTPPVMSVTALPLNAWCKAKASSSADFSRGQWAAG